MKELYVSSSMEEALCALLVQEVRNSGLEFGTLVALVRGGAIPGIYLSHQFAKELLLIEVSSYESRSQGIPSLKSEIPFSRVRGNVLVVDDLVDSGATLNFVKGRFSERGIEVHTAVLFAKGDSQSDFCVRRVPSEVWITFWYERR